MEKKIKVVAAKREETMKIVHRLIKENKETLRLLSH